MSAAAVLAIVVAVGEARNPATANLLATAEESLGPGTSIRLFEVADPSETEALRVERELGAGAVVTLVWQGPAHLHALLRVHVARNNRWTTRAIAFSAGDTLVERGRNLGLAVASMWPETAPAPRGRTPPDEESAEPPATQRPPPAPGIVPPPVIVAPASRAPRPAEASIVAPTSRVPRPPEAPIVVPAPRVPRPAEARRRFGLGVSAVGALGVGGPAAALGAGAEGVLSPTDRASLRLGASLRGGSVPELPGSDLVFALAAGVQWWLVPASAGRAWGLGIRADAVGLRHQVRATVAAGRTETQVRFVPGADLVLETTVRVASNLKLVGAVGSEVAFGTTDIRKGSERVIVATIPALRAIAQAGLRLEF